MAQTVRRDSRENLSRSSAYRHQRPATSIDQIEKTAQCWRDIGARQTKCDVRLQKSDLVAAVIPFTVRLDRMKRQSSDQPGQRVRQLDLAASTFFTTLKFGEDVRSEEHTPELHSL